MYLDKLYDLCVEVPKPPALTDIQLVKVVENYFKINLPEDYIIYQTK